MSNELLEKVINTTEVGADGGGLLNAEQSNRFIDYMWDATTLASEGRIIRMRSNTVDIDKVSVGQRITRLATEAVDDGINTEATFTKISLTTKKLRLDWELSSEALEDNIEGAALEDHIARLMATQFGNDVEDLAINGDTASADPLLKAFDGFKKLSLASGNVVDGANLTLSTDVGGAGKTLLSKAIKAMPRKYMQRRNELRFYTGVNLQQDYINGLTNVYDGRGNPPDIASGVIRGDVTAANGSAGATVPFAYGIPLKEVPLFNETLGASANQGYIELTFPQNRVWGIKRDVQVHRNFSPKKDAIEYTVFVRTGVQIENPEALVYVKDVKVTS
jgi:hypothetical protein